MTVELNYPPSGIGNIVVNGTTGSVLYIGASGKLAQSNSNFFWDSSINQLLITSSSTAYNDPAVKILRTFSGTASSPIATLGLFNTGEDVGGGDYQNEVHLILQAGTTAYHRRYINFRGFDGLDNWIFGANAGNQQITFDGINGIHRQIIYSGGGNTNSYYNAATTGKIVLNGDLFDAAGTGGVEIWAGGAAVSNVVRFTFSSAGTLTVASGNILMTAGSITIANGQAYKGTRTTSGSVFNLIGFVGGTDIVQIGLGTSAAATALQIINSGGTTLATLSGTGSLGVGNFTPTGLFGVGSNPTSLTTFQAGITYSPTATSGTTGGIVMQSISTPASNMSGANYGNYFESGTAASQANNWTAAVAGIVGCAGAIVHRGSGTVTGGAMFLTGAVTVSGGGTITTAYGYYAAKINGTGVTTGYGFYQTDTGDFNYFAGKMGLGVLAASVTAVLHLKAGTTAASTAPLKLNSGTNMTTAEAGAAEYNGNFYLSNAALRFPVGGVLFDHFADAGNTTTTETDLYSDTTAANTLNGNGDKVTASYGGIFVSSGTATRQIRVYFAGTQIFDSGALSISAGSDAWDVEVLVIRESSTVVRCVVTMTTTGATTNAYCNYTRITSLTLSGTNILKITGQAAGVGAATNDIVAKLGTVVFEPAA